MYVVLRSSALSHSYAGSASSKDPSTSKPTTAHTKTVRRNIRGETPLHVAAIKVSLVSELCVTCAVCVAIAIRDVPYFVDVVCMNR